MAGADHAKKLLEQFYQQEYEAFLTNNASRLTLPARPSIFWMGASKRRDQFIKTTLSAGTHSGKVHFISEHDDLHALAFVWETQPEKLKEGVRWGIIQPESVSGRVIAALGRYRVTAHQRIAKGMVSNTQALKLQLLDAYQSRCEALHILESMVNQDNTQADYEAVITAYMQTLMALGDHCKKQWAHTALCTLDSTFIDRFLQDLVEDMERADTYLAALPENTDVEYVPEIVAINIYGPVMAAASPTARTRSGNRISDAGLSDELVSAAR